MSKSKQILLGLSSVFLITLTWGMLLLAKTLLKTNENKNLSYLPENTDFAVRIDGRELVEKTLFSVFIESRDEEVLEMIRALLKQQSFRKNELRNAGIDYLSDILFFRINLENKPVSAILFNVSNPGLFKKGLVNSKNGYAYSDDVGLVLFENKSRPLGKERLTFYAERILRKKSNATESFQISHHQSGTFFDVFSSGSFLGEQSIFEQSDIHFGTKEKAIFLDGKMRLVENRNKLEYLTKTLKPDGFHFSGTQVPDVLNDTLNHWLKQFGYKLSPLKSISLNLRGTKILTHSSGFFVVPQMDLYIETSSPFDIARFLENSKIESFFNYVKDSNSVRFQEERLYFKQITKNSFYLGQSAMPEFEESSGKDLLKINGNMKSLLNIDGGGLVSSLLEMIPEYRAGRNLSEHVDRFELTLRKTSEKEAYLNGKIVFGESYYPMTEILRFLLSGEFFSQ